MTGAGLVVGAAVVGAIVGGAGLVVGAIVAGASVVVDAVVVDDVVDVELVDAVVVVDVEVVEVAAAGAGRRGSGEGSGQQPRAAVVGRMKPARAAERCRTVGRMTMGKSFRSVVSAARVPLRRKIICYGIVTERCETVT